MPPVEAPARADAADVCLVLEGTYPYVKGGVSTWVHQLVSGLPELRFAVAHIGPEPGAYPRRVYAPPANVVAFADLYCREPLTRARDAAALRRAARAQRHRHAATRSRPRVLRGLRRLHVDPRVDATLLDDLASGDLPVGAFLHGRATFELVEELYERLAPGGSFIDFFWHFRSMHLPLVRLLAAEPLAANAYHAVCTGFAGVLASVWSRRTGRPLVLTEHGIYSRERRLELDRATWLEHPGERRPPDAIGMVESPTVQALRRMWTRFFCALSRCAYERASVVVSLCEASRSRQVADGACAERTTVIPNGIDLDAFEAPAGGTARRPGDRHPVRVGFVGRLVPIKDVVTLIRACFIASASVPLDVRVYGPTDEDPAYVRRCRRLVQRLGLDHTIRIEGPMPARRIYSEIDLLVLTSISEGQPLVVLEAGAAGLPVVVTDVGACRELVEGRDEDDRRLGPGGIVTRFVAPEETAAAIVRLARDPALRRAMGEAGRQRVTRSYRQGTTLARYLALYQGAGWPGSAGGSSA